MIEEVSAMGECFVVESDYVNGFCSIEERSSIGVKCLYIQIVPYECVYMHHYLPYEILEEEITKEEFNTHLFEVLNKK